MEAKNVVVVVVVCELLTSCCNEGRVLLYNVVLCTGTYFVTQIAWFWLSLRLSDIASSGYVSIASLWKRRLQTMRPLAFLPSLLVGGYRLDSTRF